MTNATSFPHSDPAAAAARAEELGLSVVEYVRSLRRDVAWEAALAAADEEDPGEPGSVVSVNDGRGRRG